MKHSRFKNVLAEDANEPFKPLGMNGGEMSLRREHTTMMLPPLGLFSSHTLSTSSVIAAAAADVK